MSHKNLRSFFAFFLIVILAFSMPISIGAKSNPNESSAAKALEETKDPQLELSGYDKVKEVTAQKAEVLIKDYGVTSVQYALIDNGKIMVSEQAGVFSKNNNIIVDKDTLYGVGSVSKMFTTVAVMKLVEEKKVDLDEPVTTYIKEFEMKDKRYKDITVRMLLNHSSGILGTTSPNVVLFQDADTYAHDNLLKALKKQSLKANPGAFSVYCNDGFTLAEIIVERVSGLSFTKYIEKYINIPSAMKNTKTPIDKFNISKMARYYMPGSKKELPEAFFNIIGAGGVISTAEDLCRFTRIFMKDSSGILKEESVNAMGNKEYLRGLWKEFDEQYMAFGLGWDNVRTGPYSKYGIKAFVKGGDITDFHSNITVIPEYNIGIAVLTSGGSSSLCQLVAQEMALNTLKEKEIVKEILPEKAFSAPVKVDMPKEMLAHSGIYAYITQALQLDITEDGKLQIRNAFLPETILIEYTYTGDGKFTSPNGASYFEFVRETNGKTYLLNGGYLVFPGIGQMAYNLYDGQKLSNNKVSDEALYEWKKLDGKFYVGINEKYSSLSYLYGMNALSIGFMKQLTGYIGTAAIISKDSARVKMEIPGNSGRDLFELHTYTEKGVNYLDLNDSLYVDGSTIKNLSTKSKFTCTIGDNGYAKWYTIGSKSAGKKIKVKLPKKGAFIVYNAMAECVNDSYVSKNNTMVLPEGGFIVFAGNPGAKFSVEYK